VENFSILWFVKSSMTHPIWQDIQKTLEIKLSRPNYATWLKPTDLIEEAPGQLSIVVPNPYGKSWLEANLIKEIRLELDKHFSTIDHLRIIVSKKPTASLENLPILQGSIEEEKLEASSQDTDKSSATPRHNPFNPKYTFESFIIGNNNRLAFAAAQAVADKPGEAYNPLFIYGGVGLGKTHLMQAIGNQIILQSPKKKIAYISCETFASEFIEALQNKAINDFKKKYRSVDVFLVDDIQFLANKEGTQEEFFHTFNTLHQSNRQIVMTSDRMPKEISALEDRLISRIGWGMIADIQSPNFETRVAILKAKAEQMGFIVEKEVLEYIANNITANVRELEGSLTKLSTSAIVEDRPADISLARDALKDLSSKKQHLFTSKKILKTVTEYFNIEISDLLGSGRKRDLVYPRQIVMFLSRELLNHSYPQIGDALGGKDHSTVMHGVEKITQIMKKDPQVESDIRSIREKLEANV